MLVAGLLVSGLAAAERLPAGVTDPYGLGPRLALLDHLQEEHGIAMPAGSSWEAILARYQRLPPAAGESSYEAALERDRLQRLRQAAGVAADSPLDEAALQRRLRAQEAATAGAFGASTLPELADGIDRGVDKGASATAGAQTSFTSPAAPRSFSGEAATGKYLRIRPDVRDSEGGLLRHRYVTDDFDVLGTDQTKGLLPRVAAHAHAFRDAVLPIMRLPRRPSLDGTNIAILLVDDRTQYLQSSVRPHASTRGVCQTMVDREGTVVGVRILTWVDKLDGVVPVLQHELIHALHAAALGRLTHNWYAEGMAAFFEDWDVNESAAANLAARPRHLAALPYIRYQDSIDGVPDLPLFWNTTWNSDSPYRYQIAEAFMDYLLRGNEEMLERCHRRCLRQVPAKRYFDHNEQRALNQEFKEHIRAAMQAAGVR